MCKNDLLRLFQENTGGKTTIPVLGSEPRDHELVGYQPARIDKVHTYQKG
jgi:hypothetical protein